MSTVSRENDQSVHLVWVRMCGSLSIDVLWSWAMLSLLSVGSGRVRVGDSVHLLELGFCRGEAVVVGFSGSVKRNV